ncbi:hypothetical protein ANANG_G00238800 [Anguilla anguilla]|uniref:Uncharacterized protein n=1 Tax=Anguilla anguilla TaxID=7936 RepID=A0A9D3LUU1_ANGAN|nr:hypothetical protein ANANG_G00238800 [Anguilla anguilla]
MGAEGHTLWDNNTCVVARWKGWGLWGRFMDGAETGMGVGIGVSPPPPAFNAHKRLSGLSSEQQKTLLIAQIQVDRSQCLLEELLRSILMLILYMTITPCA